MSIASTDRYSHEPSASATTPDRGYFLDRYATVRQGTVSLADGLSDEDQVVQSMPDASPVKWHLGHTTWFFETFILADHQSGYAPFDPDFGFLFNSYYEAKGPRQPRPRRGMLTRPPLAAVIDFRRHTDDAMAALIAHADDRTWQDIAPLVELGLNHEEQHQELILTDLLHAFSCNPLKPAYRPYRSRPAADTPALTWLSFDEGLYEVGHDGDGFAFDHEGPRHKVWLRPFRLASRLVTNADWQAFIDDGGYDRAEFWLSDGWALVQAEDWRAPIYWQRRDGEWWSMTLSGMQPLEPDAPVSQISYFEADAFAHWSGKRLPTEAEWEVAAQTVRVDGNLRGTGMLRPISADGPADRLLQMYGDVWEWTQSAYTAYPGYRVPDGAVGEYNGKFMCGQFVLRGASCVTPDGHSRATYRNFFYPHQRWQFSGLRLAEDA